MVPLKVILLIKHLVDIGKHFNLHEKNLTYPQKVYSMGIPFLEGKYIC